MTTPADDERDERRRFVVAGAMLLGALVVLIALVAVVAGGEGSDGTSPTTSTIACEPGDDACLAAQRAAERPGIIPRPGEGRAPADPGEPGGWEQLALFGLIVAALGVIAALVVRSVRRNADRRTRVPDANA